MKNIIALSVIVLVVLSSSIIANDEAMVLQAIRYKAVRVPFRPPPPAPHNRTN